MTSPPNTVAADLNENQSVTLDSNGNGKVTFSPHGTRYSGYDWRPMNLFVSVQPAPGNSAIINQASATAYVSYGVQSATPSDAIGTTILGSSGDTCGMTQTLKPGDWITVVWTGGDAGAIATARVTGQADLPIPVATK
jgi:hypothetical protein